MNILKTQNESWGFWGEQIRNGEEVAKKLWNEASAWLQKEFNVDAVTARNWLDSRNGRHFADSLTFMTMKEIGVKHRRWLLDTIAELQGK